MDFSNFPAELRALPQWCVATLQPLADGKLDKRPLNARTGAAASPTDPKTWSTFEEAIAARDALRQGNARNAQIGFVFAVTDPFAVIDLDTYKAATDKTRELHAGLIDTVRPHTYIEPSQSGGGTHIIGLGSIVPGVNNEANALEMYSSGRFMICTGRGRQMQLADLQELIDQISEMIGRVGDGALLNWRDLGDGEDSGLSDAEVIERASNADNGDKFDRLCNGDMSDYGNDWSDADAALIEFLCFYSTDNNQVARLFHMTELAKRDKAHRPDYVPRTIAKMRAKLADEAIPMVDASAIQQRALAETARVSAPSSAVNAAPPAPLPVAPLTAKAPHSAAVAFPPGLVGEIAEYALAASLTPVREIALATAIGALAGVVGRQYNCSRPATGLNQYLVVLARTGTGKEMIHTVIDRLFNAAQKTIPMASRFRGPARFASGQALAKRFMDQPCFVSVLGEFSVPYHAMNNPRAGDAMQWLRQAVLDLFMKSGEGSTLQPAIYSDKEKNSEVVIAPALTLIGETAPEPFFALLNESAIENGFLPRFNLIEHSGTLPAYNEAPLDIVPEGLVTRFAEVVAHVLGLEQQAVVVHVNMDDAATTHMKKFRDFARKEVAGAGYAVAELWSRAHLKALRLASLVAVGVNMYNPIVTLEIAQWATELTLRGTHVLLDRFTIGDVGDGDDKLQHDLIGVVRRFLAKEGGAFEEYRAKGCIPMRHLQQATASRPAFKNHPKRATAAVKETIAALVEAGVLAQVPKKQAQDWFNTSSTVYCLGDVNPD